MLKKILSYILVVLVITLTSFYIYKSFTPTDTNKLIPPKNGHVKTVIPKTSNKNNTQSNEPTTSKAINTETQSTNNVEGAPSEKTLSEIMDPLTIPKFVNTLDRPAVYSPTVERDINNGKMTNVYKVDIAEFDQQLLPPPLPKTKVWGYGSDVKDPITGKSLGYVLSSPGATFEEEKGTPATVEWVNKLTGSHLFAVDPTLHWADPKNISMDMNMDPNMNMTNKVDPLTEILNKALKIYLPAQSPIPVTTHIHGLEVQSNYDGVPESWFTANGIHGATYSTYKPTTSNAAVYNYPNTQPATTLWYHDHALGLTRFNVLAGLAGLYLIRDPNDDVDSLLPSGKYEMPLLVQDRSFAKDGSLYFPTDSTVPTVHPYWMSEFAGDVILVNGKVWPNMDVDRGIYRFRLLNGSNSRFYNFHFSNQMTFKQIGTDGGYLKSPVTVKAILLGPGERADILVDFSLLEAGTKITLLNNARAPYPEGDPADPVLAGTIMQFTINKTTGIPSLDLPNILNQTLVGTYPTLPEPTKKRVLPLAEILDDNGFPLNGLLDGKRWADPISEIPKLGTTEEWALVNTTEDTHTIHLHLIQFQVVSRQLIDKIKYLEDWIKLNGDLPHTGPTKELDYHPYLQGDLVLPGSTERGWKDTIKATDEMVTILRVRFAPIVNTSTYTFDATSGPGYVWHCHILDHEDNDMMRPYKLTK